MNVVWQKILLMVAKILGDVLVNVSPGLIAGLKAFLVDQYNKALLTENPWDDFFFGLLLDILNIPRP